MNPLHLNSLFGMSEGPVSNMTLYEVLILFGHSLLLGTILSVLTYLTLTPLMNSKNVDNKKRIQSILGSSNILFLCVGLTGIMILVNNNLARALSIGATMGLIRFRVKLGSKNLGSNLLFGIIAGVACGLKEVHVAWAVTGIFIFLQGSLYLILNYLSDHKTDHDI